MAFVLPSRRFINFFFDFAALDLTIYHSCMPLFLSVSRDRNGECGFFSQLAADGDSSAVQLRYLLGDGKPKSVSDTVVGGVCLIEFFKYPLLIFL